MGERKTGLDLIKVVMMLWIIMFHLANHSVVNLDIAPISISWAFEAFCKIGGGVADCSFVLITGYLYYRKKINIFRILQLWLEVWFYSAALGMICVIFGLAALSAKDIIKMILPVIYNEYPYFSAYIVLFVLIPFLNRLVNSLSLYNHRLLVIILIFAVSVIPTFSFSSWIMAGTQLPMFIVLYFLGAGIGKYGDGFLLPTRCYNWLILILSILATWISEIVLKYIGYNPFYTVWDMNKLPVLIIAVEVFVMTKNMELSGFLRQLIITVSKSVFGVYLIHMHRTLKTLLLEIVFDNTYTYGTWKIVPQVICGAMIIYVVCILIDWIRIHTIERLFEKPLKYVSKWIENKTQIMSI